MPNVYLALYESSDTTTIAMTRGEIILKILCDYRTKILSHMHKGKNIRSINAVKTSTSCHYTGAQHSPNRKNHSVLFVMKIKVRNSNSMRRTNLFCNRQTGLRKPDERNGKHKTYTLRLLCNRTIGLALLKKKNRLKL
jgi:hypothetical protein